MQIINLTGKYYKHYFCCLEEWSDDIKEAGNHKEVWFNKIKDKGLRVKIAIEDNKACGMIQYVPVEKSPVEGKDIYFINCIWVHGHKEGVGNCQKRGIGKALLQAAEDDIKALNQNGIAAWGLSLPIWMKASWFRKQGYHKTDKNGIALLLWKPLKEGASPPRWIRKKKNPQMTPNRVTVTSFINGWCPAQNMVHERAKRASREFGGWVDFQEINTFDREVLNEWGISDGLYIDGKQIRTGPPPSFQKIKKKIGKKVNRVAYVKS